MNSDCKDLLSTFNEAGVKYLVVGGWAFMEHVEPRYTRDLEIGLPPNRVDLITQLEEMDFRSCWDRRKSVYIGDLRVEYISLPDLIEYKERTARPQDLVDAQHLRQAQKQSEKSPS